MTDIEFRVLGPLEVIVNGVTVDCGGVKQRTLLTALLVHADRVVSIDDLIEALWPGGAPATAANTLQVHISALRRSLGSERSRLETKPPGYVLRAGEALDTARFEHLARQGREELAAGDARRAHELFADAAALWRGNAFADFVYEPFAEREAARLEALRVSATADHVDARLALGHHRELLGELEALVRGHPTDERLCGQLMLALYRSGRQADALSAFSRLRSDLGEELGIVPSPPLQELHDRIVLQGAELEDGSESPYPDLPAPGASGRPPPVPLTSFIGRETERAAVLERLQRARLVTITGPGGSGKTRLAVEVAARAAQDGSVRFADLAPEDPDRVLAAVAEAIGLEGAGALSPQELAAAVTSGVAAEPRLLLVIDNCEHVVDACAVLVQRLLSEVSGFHVLATSQVSLGVSGECLVPLAPLGLPNENDPIDAIAASDAVRLFAERVSDHDPGFVLSAETAGTVARICRKLDGMPLAIELAAAQSRAFGLEELSTRLDDALGFLAAGPRTAVDRHRTLRGTVSWSVELLSEAERELLERLAVFTDGFALSRAERVCAGDGIAEADVAPLLAQLVDRSLVIRRSKGSVDRYWLLETIRQYGWQQLSVSAGA
ncbi:MAG: winged helix-turn-helix domain-containing protein [Actinobacteria bacterium]|nr:winged helix-turn-helix domain-containing protein [Actinomycetota bacterium]